MKYQASYKETPEEIKGFVDGHCIITIAYERVTLMATKQAWKVTTSSCLPTDLEWAKEYLEVIKEVFRRVDTKIELAEFALAHKKQEN